MTEKSHVSMEQHLCAVCGHPYDTGAILLDTRLARDRQTGRRELRKSLESHTITAVAGMCEEHQALADDGYIALVEASGPIGTTGNMQQEDAQRTGQIAHVRREAWTKAFNVPAPPEDRPAMVFCEPGTIAALRAMTGQEEEPEA